MRLVHRSDVWYVSLREELRVCHLYIKYISINLDMAIACLQQMKCIFMVCSTAGNAGWTCKILVTFHYIDKQQNSSNFTSLTPEEMSVLLTTSHPAVSKELNWTGNRMQVNNCGQWQPPLSGAPVNKMAVNYHKGETDPSGFRVWWNSSSLRDISVPPI